MLSGLGLPISLDGLLRPLRGLYLTSGEFATVPPLINYIRHNARGDRNPNR